LRRLAAGDRGGDRGPQPAGRRLQAGFGLVTGKIGWWAVRYDQHEQPRCIWRRPDACDPEAAERVVAGFARQDLIEGLGYLPAKLLVLVVLLATKPAGLEKPTGVDAVILVDLSTQFAHLRARVRLSIAIRFPRKRGSRQS
jgi:hypothetical protein